MKLDEYIVLVYIYVITDVLFDKIKITDIFATQYVFYT